MGRGSKSTDLAANALPFLATRVAYLISASRLTRVGHNGGLFGHRVRVSVITQGSTPVHHYSDEGQVLDRVHLKRLDPTKRVNFRRETRELQNHDGRYCANGDNVRPLPVDLISGSNLYAPVLVYIQSSLHPSKGKVKPG